MGQIVTTEFEGQPYTLSLVKWGWFAPRQKKDAAKAQTGFLPKFELAIFDHLSSLATGVAISSGRVPPHLLGFFADKNSALTGLGAVAEAIRRGGIKGDELISYFQRADRALVWGWSPFIDFYEEDEKSFGHHALEDVSG